MPVTTEASDRRAKFMRSQAATIAEGLKFAPGEEEAASRFLELAMDIYDALVIGGEPPQYAFEFHYGASPKPPVLARQLSLLSPPLLGKWDEWHVEYRAVMARQPRQALHEALRMISYSHDAASWPDGYEWKILNWIESGELTPLPFDDRIGIATPKFYDELRGLRQRSRGWFDYDHRCDGPPGVVFIPEDQLATWRQEEEAKWTRRK